MTDKKHKEDNNLAKDPSRDPSTDGGWIGKIGGRKLFVVIFAMVAVIIIAALRPDFPTEKIVETLTWLAGIGAGSIAVEDGVGRAFSRKG